jgi:hypothetical protein
MRKLLLGTTALAAAATLSANAALADLSISGYYEWRYESRSSQVTANDGTYFGNDSEIAFKWSNKTDSGLNVTMKQEFETDAGNTAVQESSIAIEGGFGKVILGGDDGVNDILPPAEVDLISEEMYYTSGAGVADTDHNLGIKNGDMANLAGNSNKITYMLPAMNGLSAGISHTNASAAGNADTTEFGASYSVDAGGASITIGAVSGTTENSTQDIDSQQLGLKVVSGNISFVLAQSEYEASGDDEQATGAAVKYQVNDGMSIAVYTSETEDDSSSEEYTNSGAELVYSIASGLSAIITVEDYDYKVGTSGNTADNGTASKLTIKATF